MIVEISVLLFLIQGKTFCNPEQDEVVEDECHPSAAAGEVK